MLAPATGLKCLITVTGCSTRNNKSNSRSYNHHHHNHHHHHHHHNNNNSNALRLEMAGPSQIDDLWSFIPKAILREGFRTVDQHNDSIKGFCLINSGKKWKTNQKTVKVTNEKEIKNNNTNNQVGKSSS